MVEGGVNWFLGYKYTSSPASETYTYERETDFSTKSVGLTFVPIGLMYAPDYANFAPSTCEWKLLEYDIAGCADKSWIKQNYYESIRSLNAMIENDGRLYGGEYGYEKRPVLYLKSNVYYLSGDGTQANPYIISI